MQKKGKTINILYYIQSALLTAEYGLFKFNNENNSSDGGNSSDGYIPYDVISPTSINDPENRDENTVNPFGESSGFLDWTNLFDKLINSINDFIN